MKHLLQALVFLLIFLPFLGIAQNLRFEHIGAPQGLQIIPPFWLTWWFEILGVIVIAACIYSYLKIQMHSVKAQKIKLEKQVRKQTDEVIAQKEALEIQQQEINKKNIALENLIVEKDNLLKEKEWLLKEIHHRVKNNLQIIMSLLNTQAWYLKDNAALTAIRESKHRIYTISLIHEKLYQSDNVASVDMRFYIHELISYLRDSFETQAFVSFEFDVEPIMLDVSQAVPVGLILTEAITNSIKYAFPPDTHGIVNIFMNYTPANNILLSITDNGVGFSEDFDSKPNQSLGMNLIKGLAGQLGASLNIKNENGVVIAIEFPEELGTQCL